MKLLALFFIFSSVSAFAPTLSVPVRGHLKARLVRTNARTDGSSLCRQVQGACLALALLTSTSIAPANAAFNNDFAGVPVETKQAVGLRGKNGNTAAPSESGLGLFVDKNGPSLLRLALPDVDVNAREVQANLELIKLRLTQVGFSGKAPVWKAAASDTARAEATLRKYKDSILAQAGPSAEKAKAVLEQEVEPSLKVLKDATKEQDYPSTSEAQVRAASGMAQVRELMAVQSGFEKASGFKVPSEYGALPRLEGRATLDLSFKPKQGGGPSTVVRVVVDGYHAPLASGAFVSQAASGAFEGVKVGYNEELIIGMDAPKKTSYLAKQGDAGAPLELFYRGDGEPSYGVSQDDDGRGADTQVLPFQAYGALGMSHPDEDVDGNKGAQFFFVKYDQGLLPPGRNTLDGAYTCFGYTVAPKTPGAVTEGGLSGGKGEGGFEDILSSLKPGDTIEKVTVVSGLENLKMRGN